MPVTNVTHDIDTRTIVINAEFEAPIQRIWQIYADPRQLEKVWGPPSCPATFVEHNFKPGGRANYYMTGPDGERYAGWWEIIAIDEPNSLEFIDGFSDDKLNPVDNMPTSRNVYTFVEKDGRTLATYVSTFETAEALQQVLDMGVIEGASSAINQIDELVRS
ncbi:activator of Hsp90 ATPase 1 family protein [Mycobacteroides abscessus subsp. abscessus]|uniref:SRPBCC family protein n=1 Tax=Mycobacteroides abscessus TaxID=36809 RepID=UPI00092A817B|nr:SRPBCC domain-containing protein [Mycobacteroides abscessus]SHS94153.1 activator of Hsp90 ATPase 1-like protein [Mycobacteroides abscessus subsp. abscessus]SHT56839.1 activator of Hsp90 ATPase 1 family protein [Mycobacteroides abscessus subsp. abscessus]SHW43125.1 activator of Hsp90 ATPase 1 family protein [Mycobacteroides abscessus subsp. abscessus]SIF81346.1 activator of Hsp90 ATPase 1 family protein [Mycobacteroides abscessus subsp. abscessus]SIK83172.1 activator of Hsp90 ATPase 1-like p